MASRDPLARSECPICPPWVIRCAHWDGRAAWLFTHAAWLEAHGNRGFSVEGVYVLVGKPTTAPADCTSLQLGAPSCILHPDVAAGGKYDNLPDALEEFYRREALLLEPADV